MMLLKSAPCRVLALVTLALLVVVPTTTTNIHTCHAHIPIPTFLSVAAKIATAYSIYSIAVDKHASRTLDAMMKVSTPHDLLFLDDVDESSQNHTSTSSITPTVAELRKSISKVSNLVEATRHRLLWNQWAACAMRHRRHHDAQNTVFNIDDIVSSINGTSATAEYQFAYRSYVNFEEKGAICRGLYSWYIFTAPFVTRGKDILQFSKQQHQNDDGNAAVLVTLQNHFWGKRYTPITITWRGHVVPPRPRTNQILARLLWTIRGTASSSLSVSPFCRIQWTSTEMVIGRGSKKTVIVNPPAAEELRQIPWDILQEEDGMMLLQRGSIGVLAFDRLW